MGSKKSLKDFYKEFANYTNYIREGVTKNTKIDYVEGYLYFNEIGNYITGCEGSYVDEWVKLAKSYNLTYVIEVTKISIHGEFYN